MPRNLSCGNIGRWFFLPFLGLLTILVTAPARADIYVYIDSHGVMHFTNTPTSSKYKVYMRENPRASKTVKLYGMGDYDDVIREAASRHGIAFSLLKALIHVESCFDPKAVSKKGAMGLCQIMPENFALLKVRDPFDPWDNIMGGARYLKDMLQRFNGELPLALAAYNAGPKAVEKYQDIPPYPETQNYVEKVIKYFQIYKKS